MEKKIIEYFGSETMPADRARRIETALTEAKPKRTRPVLRAMAAAAAMLLMVLAVGNAETLKVYADEFCEQIIHALSSGIRQPMGKSVDGIYYGYADDSTFTISQDGTSSCAGSSNRDGADVVRIQNNKMYFIVNNEEMDITELCSTETAFVYVLEDRTGTLHYFIIGGVPDDWGYLEIIADPGEDPSHPRMIGSVGIGTFYMNDNLEFIDEPWLTDGYGKIGFPENFN